MTIKVEGMIEFVKSNRTLREILEPVHKEVEVSGVSDEELDGLFDRELAAVRAERRAKL